MLGRTHVWLTLVLLLVVVAACQTTPIAPTVNPAPPYPCRFASGPIAVDGRLDEPAWQKAAVIDTFYPYQPEDAASLSPTKARLLWDKDHLYLAVECGDKDVWSFSDQPDDDMWNGDVAEFFIKPSVDKPIYYEFVIAANATLYDARYPSRGAGGANRFKGWSSNAKIASVIAGTDGDWRDDDQGYTVEAAIPLAAFDEAGRSAASAKPNVSSAGRPAAGDTWTFGIFRYDYSKEYEDPLLMMSIPEAPGHGFHSYEGYGLLVFEGP